MARRSRKLTHDQAILACCLLGGLPAVAFSMAWVWGGDHAPEVRATVTLFVTGEGSTNPKVTDGELAVAPYTVPAQPVTIMIGGLLAEMQYAGGAPGEVAGLMQVNAVIPANTAPGVVPVSVMVGGTASAAGVTVAVK